MPVNYNYLIGSFPNGIQEGQLMKEIEDNTVISTIIVNITRDGTDVNLLFLSALPALEETELNTVIASHFPITGKETVNITFNKTSIKTNTYQSIVSFGYKGSRELGNIESFNIVCKKDETATDYSIRIYDVNNNKVLAEETYTNNTDETKIITNINFLPKENVFMEVHMKVTGTGNAFLEAIKMIIE